MDEAQMVEGSTSQAAAMASRLPAVNRWCITGTPLKRGLDDIYGLLKFLRVEPYSRSPWWGAALCDPSPLLPEHTEAGAPGHGLQPNEVSPLLQRLLDITWRHSKDDVKDELSLPPQHVATKRLRLDAVGRYFYNRLHEQCAEDARATIKKYCSTEQTLDSLDSKTATRVMAPLLRLRQAACHPTLAKGNTITAGANSGKSMQDVMNQMVAQAKIKCSDSFRAVGLAKNGMAGLHLLMPVDASAGQGARTNEEQAMAIYRDFVQQSDAYHGFFKVDKLQLLHAMKNLAILLRAQQASQKAGNAGVASGLSASVTTTSLLTAPTCSDGDVPAAEHTGSLAKEIQTLHNRSNEMSNLLTATASAAVEQKVKDWIADSKDVSFKHDGWAFAAIADLDRLGSFDPAVVVDKLHEIQGTRGLSGQFSDLAGVGFVLRVELVALQKARTHVVAAIKKLQKPPSDQGE